MRRVRMRTLAAGPDGSWPAGTIKPVTQDEGAALVAGGYAEWVEPARTAAPPVADVEVETTDAPPPAESAVAPPVRRRRGR